MQNTKIYKIKKINSSQSAFIQLFALFMFYNMFLCCIFLNIYLHMYIFIFIFVKQNKGILIVIKFRIMKLYHGTAYKLDFSRTDGIYFSNDIEVAKEYAVAVDDCLEYNEKSFIYEIEIDDSEFIEEDDFEYFDIIGYEEKENIKNTKNSENGYFCLNIETAKKCKLIESFDNTEYYGLDSDNIR